MRTLLIVLVFTSLVFSENIILKNGSVIKNVKIINENDNGFIIYQKADNSKSKIHSKAVQEIDKTAFNENEETVFIENGIINGHINYSDQKRYKYPYMYLIPVSVVAFTLSYEHFDIPKGTPDKYKNKNYIYGSIYLAAGIINLVQSFKAVEVYAGENTAGISIKF